MSDYESWMGVTLPPWLQGEWGTRFRNAIGGLLDVMALGTTGGAGEAAKSHAIAVAPQDAIQVHGEDRWIHGITGESLEGYRERLVASWDSISALGPADGLEQLIADVLGASVELYDVSTDNWLAGYQPNNLEDNNAANWSRFWVVIPEPHPWTLLTFSPSTLFGPNQTFGLDITQSQISLLRQAVQQYRPAHMIPVEAWFIGDATSPAALKANHTVTSSVVRIPLFLTTWNGKSFPRFGAPYRFGERLS